MGLPRLTYGTSHSLQFGIVLYGERRLAVEDGKCKKVGWLEYGVSVMLGPWYAGLEWR